MNDDTPSGGPGPILKLESFLPYRLSVLSNRVSAAIAQDYAERFDMTVPEWRTMAALGEHPGLVRAPRWPASPRWTRLPSAAPS